MPCGSIHTVQLIGISAFTERSANKREKERWRGGERWKEGGREGGREGRERERERERKDHVEGVRIQRYTNSFA